MLATFEHLRIRPLLVAAGVLASGGGVALAQDGAVPTDPPAALLQEKLRQWVETRRTASAEAAGWVEEKRALADLNELRSREVAELDAVIEAAGDRLVDAETRRAELVEEESVLRQARAGWEAEIGALELAAAELGERLPDPLRVELGETLGRLNGGDDDGGADGRDLKSRFRDVLAVLLGAASFDSAVTLDRDVWELGGREVEVEVLYLGLARGYFVDRSGGFAGTVAPSPEEGGGWVRQEQPGIARRVRQAIDVFEKRASPVLAELPVEVKTGPPEGGGGER